LVELTADAGRILNGQANQGTEHTVAAATNAPEHEEMLPSPTTDDFLPPPVGQTEQQPHLSTEEHQPVEGAPGFQNPAETSPEQGTPDVPPESSIVGPDKPHEF